MKRFLSTEWRAEYISFLKKIHKLTLREWASSAVKVAAIVAVGFVSLFALDYMLSEGVSLIQILVSKAHFSLKWVYLIIVAVTVLILTVTVLLQQGAKGGLTSMLGSNVQYGDVTGGFTARVSRAFDIATALFFVELIFAPIFVSAGV